MITPGATLGVLGGGQLGRMFAVAARTMGYRVQVFDPDPQSPAAALADAHTCAEYNDAAALEAFAQSCAAVTVEFENVPAAALESIARFCPVRPASHAVWVCQNRMREKQFLVEHGFPVAPFAVVASPTELTAACAKIKLPALLKRAQLGYDGKGQALVETPAQAQSAWAQFDQAPCVLEERVSFEREVSVVLARSADGEVACYPVTENQHVDGILDLSLAPARMAPAVAAHATQLATRMAERLDYCGVLAVELFVLSNGELLVNEIAPRPHNSGHYTLDVCATSQFEQQVRMLCGFAPGATQLFAPAVMVNLLGDLWEQGEPDWSAVVRAPHAKLHLYGKQAARPRRKMGHYTCIGDTVEQALAHATSIRKNLVSKPGAENRSDESQSKRKAT